MKDASFGIIPLRDLGSGWEVLLIQHRSGGHWAFPKGHVELGESPKQTAERELQEETGLTVKCFLNQPPFIEKYHFYHEGVHVDKTVTYFLAEVEDKDIIIQDVEVQDFCWVSILEAANRVTFPQAKTLCQKLIQTLTQ